MSKQIEKANQLKENIENILHYYETFLEDGKCRAVKTRKLLKESEALIHSIEEDVWDHLRIMQKVLNKQKKVTLVG